MLIPRGEKGKPANRFPFLTYAILALTVLHSLLVRMDAKEVMDHFYGELAEILDAAANDEKLKLDSRLAVFITSQMDEADASALDSRFEEVLEEPQPEAQEFTSVRRPGQRSLKQAKLDEATDVALETLQAHPGYAKGYGTGGHDAARLLTHLFTYFDWPTLLGSILLLSLVGGFVEAIWGRLFWLVCFFGGGILNALVYLQLDRSGQFLFGFSAGLMALLGAFTVRYALKWVYFSFLIFSMVLPGVVVVALTLAWDVLLPTVSAFGPLPFHEVAVPYGPHAIVFGFGMLLGGAMHVFRLEAKINPFDETAESVAIDTVIQNALHAKKSGKVDYAYDLLQKETRKHANSVELLLAFWDIAVAAQKADQAVPRMLQLIRDRLRTKSTDEATEYWKVVATAHPEVAAEPRLLAQLAVLLGKESPEIAAFTLRKFFDRPGEDLTPRLAARLCRLAREVNCVIPVEIAEIAILENDPEMNDRAHLENLIATERGTLQKAPTVKPEDIVGSRAIEVADLAPAPTRSASRRIETLDETALETPMNVEDLLSTFEETTTDAMQTTPESVSPIGFSAKDLAGLDSAANLEELALPDFEASLPDAALDDEPALDVAPSRKLDVSDEGSLFDDVAPAQPSQKSVEPSLLSAADASSRPQEAAEDFGSFDPADIARDSAPSGAAASREAGSFSVEDFDTSALDPSQLLADAGVPSTTESVASSRAFSSEDIDPMALDPSQLLADAGVPSTTESVASSRAFSSEDIDPMAFAPDALSVDLPSASSGGFAAGPGLFDADTLADVAPASSEKRTLAAPEPLPSPPVVQPASKPVPQPAPPPQSAPAAAAPRPSAPAATPDEAFDDVDLSGLFGGEALPQLRHLDAQEYVPLAIETVAMLLRSADGQKRRVLVSDIQAVSFAAVHGLGEKPIVLIDVILNWRAAQGEPLQVIRLRSDRFNPKVLRPEESSPLLALRKVVADLVQNAKATALPSVEICTAAQPKIFANLAQYHQEVLNVR